MSWEELNDSHCAITRALLLVGDRWTLLILCELVMNVHRFEEIQAQTGMSSHLLTVRLKRLEKIGVVERRLYRERPNRYEYHATAKGRELDLVLLALHTWGMKWGGFEPSQEAPIKIVHKPSGEMIDPSWQMPHSYRPFSFEDCEASFSPEFSARRDARREAFLSGKQRGRSTRREDG